MIRRFITLLAIAMLLCVPLAYSASATAPAAGPAPAAAAASPSAVTDLNRATDDQKKQFYQDPKLSSAKFPLPAGFTISDFFKYNEDRAALVLNGPPRIQLANAKYSGAFNGVSFQLDVDGKSDIVAAGDQVFNNIPKGSKVSWDGRFLSLILPEQSDASGKKSQKVLQLKGDGTVDVSGDGKTVTINGASISAVYGDKGQAMSTITGKKATVKIDTSNGRIVGDVGAEVRDDRYGVFTFKEKGAALTLSNREAKIEGKFLFDTKDNRHLEVGQAGSVGHYYPGKQEFMFDKKGLVVDRDLGIKGAQSDDNKPFYVGLEKSLENELKGKNGILIYSRSGESGAAGKAKPSAGKLDASARSELGRSMIEGSNLPEKIKSLLGDALDKRVAIEKQIERDPSRKAELSKQLDAIDQGLQASVLSSAFTDPEIGKVIPKLLGLKGPRDAFSNRLKAGADPITAFNSLDAEQKKAILDLNPSFEDLLKAKFSQNKKAASGEVAIVKLFGAASGAYQSSEGQWIAFKNVLKVEADKPTARALTIELTGSDGRLAEISGKGVRLSKNEKVVIGALDWTEWSPASKPSAPVTSVIKAPKASSESEEYKWNIRNYKNYGREAVSIVEENEALKDFKDIFDADGKPDVEKIKALQAKLNEGREEDEKLTVDGKLGRGTLAALHEADASSADPSFKTSPTEPYIAQDKQDVKAQKMAPRSSSESVLVARIKEMWTKEEKGEITTEQYNDFINSLEASHPGLDIDIDSGEVNRFPGKTSPMAQARDKLGADRSGLLAEIYLSNSKNRADVDAAAAIAEKIRANPGSATLADMVELEERLRRATGSSKEAARIMLGITQGSGLDDVTVGIVKGFIKMASTEEGRKMLAPKPGSSGFSLEKLQALGGSQSPADNPLTRLYEGLIAMRSKLIAGVELSKADVDFIDVVRSSEAKALLDSMQLPDNLKKYKSVIDENIQTLQSIDISGLAQQGNPFGVARIKQTVESSGSSLADVQGNIRVADVIVSGAMATSRVREASAAGAVQLLHMSQDGVVRIKDMDGPGDVVFRVNPADPSRMIMEPVTDPSQYEDTVTLKVDLKKVMPVGKTAFTYGDKAAADNALCAIGASIGNNPYIKDNAKTLGLLSEGASSALGGSSGGGKSYTVDNVGLLTGLKLKKVIPKLSTSNLDAWAKEVNYNPNLFIQKVHDATGTKRTVTDPALLDFLAKAKSRNARR